MARVFSSGRRYFMEMSSKLAPSRWALCGFSRSVCPRRRLALGPQGNLVASGHLNVDAFHRQLVPDPLVGRRILSALAFRAGFTAVAIEDRMAEFAIGLWSNPRQGARQPSR